MFGTNKTDYKINRMKELRNKIEKDLAILMRSKQESEEEKNKSQN